MGEGGIKLRAGFREWSLELGEHVIGRSAGCNVALDDDRVSRRHAVLHVTPERVVIEDLGSSNGTLVNGVRVSDPVVLDEGDKLTIGSHQLTVTPPTGERKRQTKVTRPMPTSGTYAQPSRTDPPPGPPAPDFDDDSTATTSVFGLLDSAVDKALARDDLDEAESAASNLFLSVRAGLLRGQPIDDELLRAVTRRALELSERTERVKWLDRLFEIQTAAGRLLDWVTIDRIHRLVQRMGFPTPQSLTRYLERMRAIDAAGEDDRQRIARLEELAG